MAFVVGAGSESGEEGDGEREEEVEREEEEGGEVGCVCRRRREGSLAGEGGLRQLHEQWKECGQAELR